VLTRSRRAPRRVFAAGHLARRPIGAAGGQARRASRRRTRRRKSAAVFVARMTTMASIAVTLNDAVRTCSPGGFGHRLEPAGRYRKQDGRASYPMPGVRYTTAVPTRFQRSTPPRTRFCTCAPFERSRSVGFLHPRAGNHFVPGRPRSTRALPSTSVAAHNFRSRGGPDEKRRPGIAAARLARVSLGGFGRAFASFGGAAGRGRGL
jgi:hypothetical protein